MISPAITAIVIGIIATLAFGGGFALSDWRDSRKVERLESDKAILQASNEKCGEDVKQVKQAVQAMESVAAEKERQAAEAMQETVPEIKQHKARITKIKALPPVKPEMQCEAIKQEQIQYVQARRKGD
jgi:outer membrane murein-binding lipoprotein Lpp